MCEIQGMKAGPVQFEPGIKGKHLAGLLYGAFVSIGLATGLAVLTPYVLTVNLGLGVGEQGKALGTLAVVQELGLLIAYAMFGAMADKIGRRAVYIIGLGLVALAYAAFAYGESMTALALYRLIFAFGIGAVTGMLATIIADYAAEKDRGKLTAICGFLNGLGVIVVALGFAKLPALFAGQGQSASEAGQSAGAIVAGVAIASALILWLLLKPGVPEATAQGKNMLALLKNGIGAARQNQRIALSYSAAFVARGDLAIVGLFTIAWGNQAAIEQGMSATDAVGAGALPFVIAQTAALLWPAAIAVPLDRMQRVKMLCTMMLIGMTGYCLLVFVENPLAPLAIPFFALLGIGQISAFLGAQTIIGKEAPAEMRGAVIGVFNFCGALGILILTAVGGWMFDHVSPAAPFVLVGILNGCVALLAFAQWRFEKRTGDEALAHR